MWLLHSKGQHQQLTERAKVQAFLLAFIRCDLRHLTIEFGFASRSLQVSRLSFCCRYLPHYCRHWDNWLLTWKTAHLERSKSLNLQRSPRRWVQMDKNAKFWPWRQPRDTDMSVSVIHSFRNPTPYSILGWDVYTLHHWNSGLQNRFNIHHSSIIARLMHARMCVFPGGPPWPPGFRGRRPQETTSNLKAYTGHWIEGHITHMGRGVECISHWLYYGHTAPNTRLRHTGAQVVNVKTVLANETQSTLNEPVCRAPRASSSNEHAGQHTNSQELTSCWRTKQSKPVHRPKSLVSNIFLLHCMELESFYRALTKQRTLSQYYHHLFDNLENASSIRLWSRSLFGSPEWLPWHPSRNWWSFTIFH